MKYTNPTGELFGIDDAALIYIAANALQFGMQSGINSLSNGEKFFSGFWKGFGGGLVSGILTHGASNFLSRFCPTDLIGYTLFNAGIGAMSAGVTAYFTGGNTEQAMITGGILGGLYGISQFTQIKAEFKAACAANPDLPRNADGSIDYNSRIAKEYYDKWFPNSFRNKIYTNGEGLSDDPRLSYNTEDGSYYYDSKRTDGLTSTITNSRKSNVYLGEKAFISQWKLYLVMGHENIHVLDYSSGRWNPSSVISGKRTEERAYNWDIDQYLKYYPPGHMFYNHPQNLYGFAHHLIESSTN